MSAGLGNRSGYPARGHRFDLHDRPLVGAHGQVVWWFDGDRLRIALLVRPVR